jgi:hypothetical protein
MSRVGDCSVMNRKRKRGSCEHGQRSVFVQRKIVLRSFHRSTGPIGILSAFALWLQVLPFILIDRVKNPLPNAIHAEECSTGARQLSGVALSMKDILFTPSAFCVDIR